MARTSSILATKSASSSGGIHQYALKCGFRSFRFNILPTVARLIDSSRMTADSRANNVSVHLAYPGGGAVHAFATILASTSPVAFRRALSEFGLRFGVIAAATPPSRYFWSVSMTVGTDAPARTAISRYVGRPLQFDSSASRMMANLVRAFGEGVFF